jgi:hypothetical protein
MTSAQVRGSVTKMASGTGDILHFSLRITNEGVLHM